MPQNEFHNPFVIPSWLINGSVIVLGGICAIYLGAYLAPLDWIGGYFLIVAIICTYCIVSNNFPLLLAIAVWAPLTFPVPFFRNFPTIGLVWMWFVVAIFFRVCVTKSLSYIPSCNKLLFLCFLWVPIRFMINPVHKLGGSVLGGKGVSGANAYFLYALAGVIVITLGCILNTREKVLSTLRSAFRVAWVLGSILIVCAFIPSTQAGLNMIGITAYSSGSFLRIIAFPVFGMLLVGAALCRNLFRIHFLTAAVVFTLGMGMIILSGDRGGAVAVLLFAPVVLLTQKKFLSLFAFVFLSVISILALHQASNLMDLSGIPGLGRIAGLLDTKTEAITGGDASAQWRYDVWQKGVSLVMQAPLIGKGYGNLPMQLNPDETDIFSSDNYEGALAAGMAHNGYISAAYGFGIPFMVGLTVALIYRMFRHMIIGMRIHRKDLVLCQFHSLIAGYIASFGLALYAYADMSFAMIWFIVGLGIVMENVTNVSKEALPVPAPSSNKPPGMLVPSLT